MNLLFEKNFRFFCIIVLYMILLSSCNISSANDNPYSDISAIEMQKILESETPIGAKYEKVVGFLASKGITPSKLYDYLDYDDSGQEVKLKMMTASIKKRSVIFSNPKIYMVFYFDEKSELKKYYVKETFTSP